MIKRRFVGLALLVTALGCFPDVDRLRRGRNDTDAASDADADDAGPTCGRSCADLMYCNGVELCAPDDPSADEDGCAPATNPCASYQLCNETLDTCTCKNQDGDPFPTVPCGSDCDDGDPNRYPGRAETCDASDHDEDCDCTSVGALDADGDEYTSDECCNCVGTAGETCGADCDDSNGAIHPGAVDTVGDSIDSDCDGSDG